MPASTTLKLPENLKQRVGPLAKSVGKTPHAWMIEAIEAQASLAEKRKDFVADALAAENDVRHSGKAYRLDDVRSYMRNLAQGKKTKRPKPVKW